MNIMIKRNEVYESVALVVLILSITVGKSLPYFVSSDEKDKVTNMGNFKTIHDGKNQSDSLLPASKNQINHPNIFTLKKNPPVTEK